MSDSDLLAGWGLGNVEKGEQGDSCRDRDGGVCRAAKVLKK